MLHEQVKKLLGKGPAAANRYSASFSGGGIITGSGGAAGGSIGWASGMQQQLRTLNEHSNLLISNVQFPGRSFATGQMRGDQAIGHTRKYVHSMMFNEFAMTYTLTGELEVHSIFNMWAESLAARKAVGKNPVNRRDVRINYYHSYIDPKIILKKMERDGSVSLVTNVYNAFPLNVSDLALSASSNSSTLEFTVNFAYESFENMYGGKSSEQVASSAEEGDTLKSGDGPSNAWTDTDLGFDYGSMSDADFGGFTEEPNFNTNWDAALGPDDIDYNSVMQLDVGESNSASRKIAAEERKFSSDNGRGESPDKYDPDSETSDEAHASVNFY